MLLNKFPNLKCHAFCPPGGLLSDKLSTHCEKFVTSFINNADIIPRMSLSNCEKLRDESLEVLARVKVSKMQLFRAFSYKVSDHQVPTLNKLLLCPAEETPKDTEFYQELHRFRDRLKSRNSVAKKRVPLYPPGRILYVIRRNEGHAGGEKSVCTPQWAEKTDFNEILLSSSFVEDHMLVSVIPNLELVLESLTNPEMSSYNDNEIIDSVFDKDFDEQEFELSERKFIFCSLPNGNVPFVAGILVFVAVFLAFVGNNHCAFVEQSTDWIDAEDGSVVLGTNQSVGLFRYEKKDYVVSGEISNPDSIASSGTCVPFPSWYPSDASLLGSRVLGFIGIASGCFSMLFLSLSLCAKCPRSIWRLITSLIAIAMVSQVLVFFLFLRCGVCTEFEYTEGDYHLFSASECELSSGAYFAIASMTLWFFAFVLTLRYPKPKF